MNKTLVLVVVLAAIVGAIVWLQEPQAAKEVVRVMPVTAGAQEAQTQQAEQATTCRARMPEKKSGSLAPELAGIEGYINAQNITLGELVGKKVILVDFWTYSCINCQRTLPYLAAWHEKYNGAGLEIIGVHAPEFAFEKKYENVLRAVEKWNIGYPVVLDNNHQTWNAWHNRYWPAKYLIDIDGYVMWYHYGEGSYAETENKIQALLAERAERLCLNETMNGIVTAVGAQRVDFEKINTPEIYLGSVFTRGNFGSKEGLPAGQTVTYAPSAALDKNHIYLEGTWYVDTDHVRLVSKTGKIVLRYDAKNVNIVASGEPGSDIAVSRDDASLESKRVDVEDLYNVIVGEDYGEHVVQLDVTGEGFKLYTFTFG